MFNCSRISSVEYYLAENDADKRDQVAYYTDNGAEEDKGVWWTNARLTKEDMKIPLVNNGSEVKPKDFRALAAGRIPISGKQVVQSTKNRSAGYDLQFGAPKSVSVLWACAPDDKKKLIEQAQREAVFEALNYAHENGFITTRRGKGGEIHERPKEIQAATFMHTTSRAGDPQIHTHAVLTNVCRREDGTYGTIDNATLMKHKQEMGAVYRLKLIERMEKLVNVKAHKEGRNFEIDGISDKVCQIFSKRSEVIKEVAEEKGIDTTSQRAAAQVIAYDTRNKKSEIPSRDELKQRWSDELNDINLSKDEVFNYAIESVGNKEIDNEYETPDNEYETPGHKVIAEITKTDAAIEERKLVGTVFEEWQGIGTLEDALKNIQKLKDDGLVIEVGENENGKVYATQEMIEREKRIIRNSVERQNERHFIYPDSIEDIIAARQTMSKEQADAVRHALNNDGVSVIEGSAGTGKSFSLGAVAEVARDVNMRVHVIAPSHKAKDVLRADTSSNEEDAQTVQGFISRLNNPEHKEHFSLKEDDCIIVDEAGMCGTSDIDAILSHARKAGCKVILAGDTRQLQPVAAGSPMALIAEVCGTQRINEIRRQKVDWQREASMKFAKGETENALKDYDENGCIKISSYNEALDNLVSDYQKDITDTDNKDKSRIVLSTTNKDVSILNERLRTAYKNAGYLTGSDIKVKAKGRGRNAKTKEMDIAVGDKLIFGESIKVGNNKINNSDICMIKMMKGDVSDPIVTLEFEKGITVESKWSELSKKNQNGEREDVKCQHAYAVTVHAAQGLTVNNAYVFNGNGMGQESSYVAMTRHKDNATMYVNADRLEKTYESTFTIDSRGHGDGKDVDDIGSNDREFTREEIFKQFAKESSKKTNKVNISDFIEDKKTWASDKKTDNTSRLKRESKSRDEEQKKSVERAKEEREKQQKRAIII